MKVEVNLKNFTPEEREQFDALVEKANKPKKVWKPINGERYYLIHHGIIGGIDCFERTEGKYDERAYSVGNCFKTKEEAEFTLERLKVIAEMKRYIAEHDSIELDWSNGTQQKCILTYDHALKLISVDSFSLVQEIETSLYASSRKIMKSMINEIGEDRIKKYYFGVE